MNELLIMLESKYKRLEYIQSTGTQWIDTGVIPSADLGFQITFLTNNMITNVANQFGCIFGGRYTSGNNDFQLTTFKDVNKSFKGTFRYGGISAEIDANITLNQKQTVTFHYPNYINPNGITTTVTSYTWTANAREIYLFGLNNNGTFAQSGNGCRIYSCIFYDDTNNIILRNFVPVLRKSDNEIGMLDLVEGKFYGNAGTGKFTANLDTMYALIQGTPTVQDGRVSGFSASNYLRIQNTITNIERTEIVLDYTIGSNLNNTGMSVFSSQEWAIQLYKPTNSDTKYTLNLGGSKTSGTHEFSANEYIRVKILVENNYLYIYYYDFSNNDWVLDVTYPPNEYTWSKKNKTQLSNIIFGDNQTHSGTRVFTGSMNLNNSYIKIDDTKYKLQAVVGYSEEGTLTENPTGVFSGFSASDYLTLPSLNGDNLEIVIDFTTGASFNSFETIFRNSQMVSLEISNLSNLVSFNWQTSNYVTIVSNIQYNTNYTIKIKKNNDNIIFYCSVNGGSFVQTATMTTNKLSNSNINIGNSSANTGRYCIGTINLNKTYIKINNKLWFNGLEA